MAHFPISWEEFNKLKKEWEQGVRRLEALEAEMMGDQRTGRPSLRVELTEQMNAFAKTQSEATDRMEKRQTFISRTAIGILIVLIAATLVNIFDIGVRANSASKSQVEQSK
jgi:hypothetical protein